MTKKITLLNEDVMLESKEIRAYYHPSGKVSIPWDTQKNWLNTRTNDSLKVACSPYSTVSPYVCTKRHATDPYGCYQWSRNGYFSSKYELQFGLSEVRDSWSTPEKQILYVSYC